MSAKFLRGVAGGKIDMQKHLRAETKKAQAEVAAEAAAKAAEAAEAEAALQRRRASQPQLTQPNVRHGRDWRRLVAASREDGRAVACVCVCHGRPVRCIYEEGIAAGMRQGDG